VSHSDLAVSVNRLEKRYGTLAALAGVSLEVEPGTLFGLLGQNGAGKTTLIKILLGLVAPTAGTASLLGQPVGRLADARFVNQGGGVIYRTVTVSGTAVSAPPARADGLIIEVHCDPDKAMSDGAQSLFPGQFDRLMAELRIIAPAIGRSICLEPVARRGWAR
jgi:energy-coupling factor transporter ATP-binding protein EcfA2